MVSIIMPFYNEEEYIKFSINSILNQTYHDFELLLIDDGSSDRSLEIVSNISDNRIKILHYDNNHGTPWAKNQGLRTAQGKYITVFAADDIACSESLEKEVKFLDEHNDIMAVSGQYDYIDKDNKILNMAPVKVLTNPKFIKASLLFENCICDPFCLFRRKVIDDYDIFNNEDYYSAQDYQFWCECSLKGNLTNIPEVLFHYRINHGSKSNIKMEKDIKRYNHIISNILTWVWTNNGFSLSKEEIYIVFKYFFYNKPWENIDVLKKSWTLLQRITKEARQRNMDNAEEIASVCRLKFGEKMKKSFFLWEQDYLLKEIDYKEIEL